jgi:hypothetical protein
LDRTSPFVTSACFLLVVFRSYGLPAAIFCNTGSTLVTNKVQKARQARFSSKVTVRPPANNCAIVLRQRRVTLDRVVMNMGRF